MKRYFISLAIILCVLLSTGCLKQSGLSGTESTANSEPSDYASPIQLETEKENPSPAQTPTINHNIRTDDEDDSVDGETTNVVSPEGIYSEDADISFWLGTYYFYEGWPSEPDEPHYPIAQSISYNIYIYEDDDGFYAEIDDWGWQTRHHIRAKIVGDERGIDILFEDYLEEHVWGEYQEGEMLLSLSLDPVDNQIYTTWHSITSETAYINEQMTGIYFEKTDR